MKKIIISVFLLISLMALTNAANDIESNYEIFGNKVLVEINRNVAMDFEYSLPLDYENLEINTEQYTIENNVLVVPYVFNLEFSYVSESLIERASSRNLFILSKVQKGKNMLTLPEGAIVDDLVVPDADSITTDGKLITLIWNDFQDEEIVVAYKYPSSLSWGYVFGVILLVVLFGGYFVYSVLRFKKMKKKVKEKKKKKKVSKKVKQAKKKKELTRNLFGEEKKIVEYLLGRKRNESWTKEIVRDLEISKVRLSRRLRNLVQRGLIEKTPYGNENRIRLLKK